MTAETLHTTALAHDDEGSGPAIAFVHGLTFSRLTWRPIVARLRDRFRCISVDLPGHGDTPGPARRLDECADLLDQTLARLHVDAPVVVGHSMGAPIAVMYAGRHPCRGVVNVDQTPLLSDFVELLHRMAPALRGEHFDQAFEPFRESIGVHMLPAPVRQQIEASQRVEQRLVLGYWDQIFTSTPEQIQDMADDSLDAVRAPYLHVAGQALPDADREHLLRHLPGARVEEWPGRGHMVHLAEPDRFAQLLADFVSAVHGSGSVPSRVADVGLSAEGFIDDPL